MSHPVNWWKNPSALSGSQYCTSNPVPTIRNAFAATAIGMEAIARMTLMPTRFSSRYPYITAKQVRESSECMPLQASATSSGIAGRLITFPSRRTGTPSRGNNDADNFDARICRGNVISFRTIDGIGTIRTKKASGNSTALSICQPDKKMIMPASKKTREIRERKSSAPNTPRIKVHRERSTSPRPHEDGLGGTDRSFSRFCHRT